jgi:hypothetical protein
MSGCNFTRSRVCGTVRVNVMRDAVIVQGLSSVNAIKTQIVNDRFGRAKKAFPTTDAAISAFKAFAQASVYGSKTV